MTGFIAVHRSLWDNDAFSSEPMSEREAWLWMIAKAAFKPTKHRVGSNTVDVQRGSFFCTLRELQKTFGWKSVKRVRSFLKLLENETMISLETGTGKTQVTICNYDKFQDVGHKKETRGAQPGHSRGTLKNNGNKGTSNPNGLQPEGVSDQVWSDFVKHRKRKRSDITQTAIDGIRREAEKAGWSMQDAVREIVTRGWVGFNADWVEKRTLPGAASPKQTPEQWLEFCEQQVRKARRNGDRSGIGHWEAAERKARAKLPRLQVVK